MIYVFKKYNIKLIVIIIISFLFIILFSKYKTPQFRIETIDDNNLKNIIEKLNFFSNLRKPKYYIFADLFTSNYCCDKNAYFIFEYCLKHKYNAYYIINSNSDLYKLLLEQNKTNNLILFDAKKNMYNILFPYLLNSKIIVLSYIMPKLHRIISEVSYIKYLRVNHGVRYFKPTIYDLPDLIRNKRNTIISSPLEYKFIKNNYSRHQIYKAGLPRWDRFNNIKKNESERDCILVSFTRREYNNDVFEKSLYKHNLEKIFGNMNFINYLKDKNIDLIYIPHHRELYLNKIYTEKMFESAILSNQKKLEHYIEQCSLLITDFSSLCFDFFVQSKPVLFYFIDINDTINFDEKNIYKNESDYIYFGNAFRDQNKLIKKVKYYIDKKFQIEHTLKNEYNSLFYCKKGIIKKIFHYIETIISK